MEELEFVGVGGEDGEFAVFVDGVELVADEGWGGGEDASEAAFPHGFSGVGFPACGDAAISDGVEIAVFVNHGGDVDTDVVFPGDFAGTISDYGGDVVFGVTSGGVDVFAVSGCGGDAFGGGTFDFPVHFSGYWIEAGDEVAAGHDELVFAEEVVNDWRGIVGIFGAFVFPNEAAVGRV